MGEHAGIVLRTMVIAFFTAEVTKVRRGYDDGGRKPVAVAIAASKWNSYLRDNALGRCGKAAAMRAWRKIAGQIAPPPLST